MTYSVQIDDKLGMDASVRVLEWTTEPPTKEGWYFAIQVVDEQCVIVKAEQWGKTFSLTSWYGDYDGDRMEPHSSFSHFLGPLPEPPMPK